MDKEELQKQIDDVSSKVTSLENDLAETRSNPITRLVDNQTEDRIREIVSRYIEDIVWEEYYQHLLVFSSTSAIGTVGNAPTLIESTIRMATLASTNGASGFTTAVPGVVSKTFDKDMRFRTILGLVTTTNQDAEIGMGGVATTGITGNGFGFVISGDSVSGFCQTSAASRSTVDLNTDLSTSNHTMEARLYAGTRVDFYIDDELKGSVAGNLPAGSSGITFSSVIITSENVAKTADVTHVEFLQKLK